MREIDLRGRFLERFWSEAGQASAAGSSGFGSATGTFRLIPACA
jgi:hypothetical protein